jgi:hypothetical protein
MHIKLYILIFFLLSAKVAAQDTSDSLVRLDPLNPANRIYSVIKPGIGIDSTSGHGVQISMYHNQMDISETQFFYNNLRKAAQRTSITRWLHRMIVRDPSFVHMPARYDQRSESEFTAYEGKIIRNINLGTTSLFAPSIDVPYYTPTSKAEQIGKFLHINTNERIIRNNILFSSGDYLNPFLLSDNERILRQLSYIEDARIYIIEDPEDPSVVDIMVITKDRWSKGFDIDMSEIDEGRIEFYDRNILGLGQEIQTNLLFNGGNERVLGFQGKLNINNIAGTFIRSGINYINSYDQKLISLHGGRNFLTPSMKYAGGIMFSGNNLLGDFNFPDTLFINQRLNYNNYDYWFGRSFQLSGRNDNMYFRRNLYITSRFNRDVFFERPDFDEKTRYIYHNKNLFLLSLTMTQLGYLKSRYIYGFGPTEDIPVGSKIETTLAYEDNQFFPRWYTGLSVTHSHYLDNTAYLKNNLSIGGFNNDGTWEQGVFSFQTAGFSSLFEYKNYFLRQFFALNYTNGIRRFADERVSISNRDGIRGLRSDQLRGVQKLTVQLETMLYSKRIWYGFRYAFYTMADLGWIGAGKSVIVGESFYSGLGIGMRVRNEHLVLPTIQFRFAWFPRVPEAASTSWFYIMSERSGLFDEYKVTAPDLLPYR